MKKHKLNFCHLQIIYQQQHRIVITTFNLLSLYYASQLYAQRTVTIDELAQNIAQLKHIFEELGAHVCTNMNAIKAEIIETVEIHSNIVHFEQGQLQFSHVAATQVAQEVDAKRLKAHALSPHTMALAVPTLALQLYINPCLFWLARPAFLIMAALQQQKIQEETASSDYARVVSALFKRVAIMEDIFKQEFIMESNRNEAEFQHNLLFLEVHGILRICKQSGHIQMLQNECSRVVLSALAPFLCLYYQLAVVLNQVGSCFEYFQDTANIRKLLKAYYHKS